MLEQFLDTATCASLCLWPPAPRLGAYCVLPLALGDEGQVGTWQESETWRPW